jgi:hypothetical protein
MSAEDAYKRAFHCGVGGHDGHPEDPDIRNNPEVVMAADRCALAVEWAALKKMVKDQSELIIELGAKLNAVKLRLEEKQDETCEFCPEGAPCCEKFDNSYGEMLRPTITVCTPCWNKASSGRTTDCPTFPHSHEVECPDPGPKGRTSLDECPHGVWLGDYCWTCPKSEEKK